MTILFFFVLYVLTIGMSFLLALIFHLLAQRFKGSGTYMQSFNVVAYSMGTIAGVLTIVLFFFRTLFFSLGANGLLVIFLGMSIWAVIIIAKGYKEQYNMNEFTATVIIFCVVVPLSTIVNANISAVLGLFVK